MTEYEKILSTEYSEKFDKIRKDAMVMSHYKYGFIKDNAQKKAINYLDTIKLRIKKYEETGNTEFLADVANFCMIEFMYPQHPSGHYKPTDSKESPGLVGMSTKEIEDYIENCGDI